MNMIAARESFDGQPLEIALINNMPDQASEATAAQFASLARAGARDIPFRLRCYTLPTVPRGKVAREALARTHEDIAALYARGADALIVTGTEPRAERLEDEPYWSEFSRLVEWARVHTTSALWSCLAAHGAILRLDAVRRRGAKAKIFGVFTCEVAADDWATRGADGSNPCSPFALQRLVANRPRSMRLSHIVVVRGCGSRHLLAARAESLCVHPGSSGI